MTFGVLAGGRLIVRLRLAIDAVTKLTHAINNVLAPTVNIELLRQEKMCELLQFRRNGGAAPGERG